MQTPNDFSDRAFYTENLQIWDAHSGKPASAMWRTPVRKGAATNLRRASCVSGSNLLLLAGLVQQPQVWQLPEALAGSPERIRVWIETLTGTELDAGGAVEDLDAKAWKERYERLQKLGGPPAKREDCRVGTAGTKADILNQLERLPRL
jgi:hypothetical protein